MWRVDSQVDWDGRNSGVLASFCLSLFDNFISDFIKVIEFLVGNVQEFTPFVLVVFVHLLGGDELLRVRGIFSWPAIDELENKGASCNDTSTTRQEITTNNVLKHGGLSAGLRTDDGDLGKVDSVGGWAKRGQSVLENVSKSAYTAVGEK